MSPLVSICVPTCNGSEFISEAMDSVLTQTYSNLEIIVSDDASTDSTLAFVERYKNKTKIPIYVYHHQPNGIGSNWNNCIKHAKGKYIKFLFQDDVLEDTCVEKMVKVAEQSDRIGLVYCKRTILYDMNLDFDIRWFKNFNKLHSSWFDLEIEKGVLRGKRYLGDKNLLAPPLNKIGEPTAVLLRKTCIEKTGYFSKSLEQALDQEFWYRFMRYFDIGFVNESLVKFRLHPNQATQKNFKDAKLKLKEAEILNKLIFREYFWHLHPHVQFRLIMQKLGIDRFGKLLKRIKQKLYKIMSLNSH